MMASYELDHFIKTNSGLTADKLDFLRIPILKHRNHILFSCHLEKMVIEYLDIRKR